MARNCTMVPSTARTDLVQPYDCFAMGCQAPPLSRRSTVPTVPPVADTETCCQYSLPRTPVKVASNVPPVVVVVDVVVTPPPARAMRCTYVAGQQKRAFDSCDRPYTSSLPSPSASPTVRSRRKSPEPSWCTLRNPQPP